MWRAEALYGRALEENPDDIDSLHMLGVVKLERMRYRAALDVLWDVAEKTGWSLVPVRHNLGLVLGKLMAREANAQQAHLLASFLALEDARQRNKTNVSPLVSVVLPAYNHACYVAQAIASVAVQTYPRIEFIVIDDGSTDGTPAAISEAVKVFPFPVRYLARENRGAPATLNEGAALAQGKYIAFLNSDDYFAPDRIAAMVEEIAATGALWGFSLAASVAGVTEDTPDVLQRQQKVLGLRPNSFTFVEYNIAISSGNLFVEREFFFALEGFRDHRYNHDWDFCLRATAVAEPVVVHRPLYYHRAHNGKMIGKAGMRAKEDTDRVLGDFVTTALAAKVPCSNAVGPYEPDNRTLLLRLVFGAGLGSLVPINVLRSLAVEKRATRADGATNPRKAALIVLGMHRSGTSAMARVLNLCGAALPTKLVPAKPGDNPKGFWEAEAVVDLNVRAMRLLGGDWKRVDFEVPTGGEVADEFETDARALIEAEYDNQESILIKDPRICILTPLWHRALIAAGYRPVYVVTVRNPLEIAQSLRARDDMTVSEGLRLWLAYMSQVEEFVASCDGVIHVRFTDLLHDWRSVVGRIADRLDVPLDAGGRAEEVDRFLEGGMRRQVVADEALDMSAHPSISEIRALYRRSLLRCDQDAGIGQLSQRATGQRITIPADCNASAATVSFVLCIEGNAIREQALLLCESIRRFAGRYDRSPILAFAPRPGLGVDEITRSMLEEMDVEYVDEPLNTTCLDYAPANRIYAGAYAEAHATTDFLAVLDSDTIWFDELALPIDADAAVRPVDSKGSATRGPGDQFEEYWERLAQMSGISLDRLPWLASTIGNERIRASYNAGLTVARRNKGILRGCAELFTASVRAGMRPYRDGGMDIRASTGNVGRGGSEYWGASQAALALAIWEATDRVLHYPDHYNVPLHLIADGGDIDPRWLAHPPVHVHYHYMFGEPQYELAMDLLVELGLSSVKRDWLTHRIPFRDRRIWAL